MPLVHFNKSTEIYLIIQLCACYIAVYNVTENVCCEVSCQSLFSIQIILKNAPPALESILFI